MTIAKDDNSFTEIIIVLLKMQITLRALHCYQNGQLFLNSNCRKYCRNAVTILGNFTKFTVAQQHKVWVIYNHLKYSFNGLDYRETCK